MAQVKVIFVRGQDNLVDNVIAGASHGPYVHVAIKVPGVGLVESLGNERVGIILPGVRISPWRKYDSNPDVTIIDVELPDMAAAQVEAEKMFGRPYGYDACIDGGMQDMFGVQMPGNGELTANCSETVTRILRAGGRQVLPDQTADSVTPMALMRALN